MGDVSKPVNLWQWSSGTASSDETVKLLNAAGYNETEERDAVAAGFSAIGAYDNGTWRVVMKRPINTPETDKDIQFEEGRFIPIAFANWDGSNSEVGSKHTFTTWYWLLLKPDTGAKPIISALIVAGLILGLLIWWARSAGRARPS